MPQKLYKNKVERDAWRNMLHRCHNKDHRDYSNYGARGITVCDEWRNKETGFAAFLNHIGHRPDPSLSLERIHNDKGYQPGNVRWATKSEQQSNRRHYTRSPIDNRITIKGVTKTTVEWSKEYDIPIPTILKRYRDGRKDEEIIHKGRLQRPSSSSNVARPDIYL